MEDDRLSVDDARILALESAAIAGHTLKLVVLEPGAERLDLDALRESVEARLPAGSKARCRVELDTEPRWVPAEPFSIVDHVVRVPGGLVAALAPRAAIQQYEPRVTQLE